MGKELHSLEALFPESPCLSYHVVKPIQICPQEPDREVSKAANKLRGIGNQLKPHAASAGQGILADEIASLDNEAEALGGSQAGMFGFSTRGIRRPNTLMSLRSGLLGLMGALQSADVATTFTQMPAVAVRRQALGELMKLWAGFKAKDLAIFNEEETKANPPTIDVGSGPAHGDR